MKVELTKLSGKGQIVLPSDIRNELKFKVGDKFLVIGKNNTIILKKIEEIGLEKSFDEITEPIRKKVERFGITRKDVEREIKKYRIEKKVKK